MYVSLGRFQLTEDSALGVPAWVPPVGVSALVDLVPPKLDAEPAVNFALMLSETPLDSSDAHYTFGDGHVTETTLSGTDRDAWESVTGYRPQANTIADCLAEHLLRSPADDRANPLTCGANRGLEIHLDGVIWSHTLSGLTDPFSQPVLRIEAEGLASIYREEGETQYRLAMGGVRRKYATRPIKELIAILFPSGRDDLPLLDELTPQTSLTENWPSTGAITSGQNNTWSNLASTLTVTSANNVANGSNSVECLGLSGYTFGGSNRTLQWTCGTSYNASGGGFPRCDAAGNNGYLHLTNAGQVIGYKRVGGGYTQLGGNYSTCLSTDVLIGSNVGSTISTKKNGSSIDSRTDTSIASGTRTVLRIFGVSQVAMQGPVVMDDLISSGNRRRRVIITGGGN